MGRHARIAFTNKTQLYMTTSWFLPDLAPFCRPVSIGSPSGVCGAEGAPLVPLVLLGPGDGDEPGDGGEPGFPGVGDDPGDPGFPGVGDDPGDGGEPGVGDDPFGAAAASMVAEKATILLDSQSQKLTPLSILK